MCQPCIVIFKYLLHVDLSTKFGAFPIKFKRDMRDSLKHALTLCYHGYLSV